MSALLLLTIMKLRNYAKHKSFAIISVISKMSGSNFVVCTVLPLLHRQHNSSGLYFDACYDSQLHAHAMTQGRWNHVEAAGAD